MPRRIRDNRDVGEKGDGDAGQAACWPSQSGNGIRHADPFPLFDPTISLTLRGDWQTGGILEFLGCGKPLKFMQLAPVPWALLAVLFRAAIEAKHTHWSDAYVATRQLADWLGDNDVVTDPCQQRVYQLVSTIRSKLAASDARRLVGHGQLSGSEWAALMLENMGRVGYRIGLPPSQLRLVIRHDEHPAPVAPAE